MYSSVSVSIMLGGPWKEAGVPEEAGLGAMLPTWGRFSFLGVWPITCSKKTERGLSHQKQDAKTKTICLHIYFYLPQFMRDGWNILLSATHGTGATSASLPSLGARGTKPGTRILVCGLWCAQRPGVLILAPVSRCVDSDAFKTRRC